MKTEDLKRILHAIPASSFTTNVESILIEDGRIEFVLKEEEKEKEEEETKKEKEKEEELCVDFISPSGNVSNAFGYTYVRRLSDKDHLLRDSNGKDSSFIIDTNGHFVKYSPF